MVSVSSVVHLFSESGQWRDRPRRLTLSLILLPHLLKGDLEGPLYLWSHYVLMAASGPCNLKRSPLALP